MSTARLRLRRVPLHAAAVVTIVLWCVESKLAWLLGDMGIIAILPIVLFYGTGVLRKVSASRGCPLATI